MATCSAQDLLTAANCFDCLTPFQLQLARTSLLCQILQQRQHMASCDAQSLLDSAKCLDCLTPNQLALVSTQLLCEILNAGGGSGCLVCSENTDPVDAPDCDCALAYRSDNGRLWFWSAVRAVWDPILT